MEEAPCPQTQGLLELEMLAGGEKSNPHGTTRHRRSSRPVMADNMVDLRQGLLENGKTLRNREETAMPDGKYQEEVEVGETEIIHLAAHLVDGTCPYPPRALLLPLFR